MPERSTVHGHGVATPRAADEMSGGGGVSSTARDIVVLLENGLHMAPASEIVKLADRFGCEVALEKGANRVNGKSILDMLTLAVERGQTVRVEIRGGQSDAALQEVVDLLEGRTGHR